MKFILDLLERGVNSSLLLYENKLKSKLSYIKNFSKKITTAVKKTLQKIIAFVFGKPNSVKDYFHLTQWYVSKRFLLKSMIFLVVGALIAVKVVIPYLSGRLWPASLVVNSNQYHEFTGKAKVFTKDGYLLYKGTLQKGAVDGSGEVYDENQLIYKGELKNSRYEGEGVLYNKKNQLIYQGNFLDNLYDGNGTLYFENGKKRFVGTFEKGQMKDGTEYYSSGNKKYIGLYENGLFTGNAKIYEDNEKETLRYSGNLESGRYNGKGRLYKYGSLLYDGDFLNNVYHGQGKLYADGQTIYEGTFSNGSYDGQGKLYQNGKLIYKGNFLEGNKNGEGNLFSAENGKLLYEGNFKDDFYDQQGKLYDEKTGRLLYEGTFAQGVYNGEGTLYSASGQKLFTGNFYNGDIDYMAYCKSDIDEIRTAFGKESSLEMLDGSFLLVYKEMKIIFEFPFAENETKPVVNKMRLFGSQKVQGASTTITLGEFTKSLGEKTSYTSYSFAATLGEALMSLYTDSAIKEGDILYCVKYLFDDYYIRVYAVSSKDKIYYYEIGGI